MLMMVKVVSFFDLEDVASRDASDRSLALPLLNAAIHEVDEDVSPVLRKTSNEFEI